MPALKHAQIIEALEDLLARYTADPSIMDIEGMEASFSPEILANIIEEYKQHTPEQIAEIEQLDQWQVSRHKIARGHKGTIGSLKEQVRTHHIANLGDKMALLPIVGRKTITGAKFDVNFPGGSIKNEVKATVGIIIENGKATFVPFAVKRQDINLSDEDIEFARAKNGLAIQTVIETAEPGLIIPEFFHVDTSNADKVILRHFMAYAEEDLFVTFQKKLDPEQLLFIFYNFVRTGAALAKLDIVHRDIKLENTFAYSSRSAKTSFGNPVYVARIADWDFAVRSPHKVELIGTPDICPPEGLLSACTGLTFEAALEKLMDYRTMFLYDNRHILGLDYAIILLLQHKSDPNWFVDGKLEAPADDLDGAFDRWSIGICIGEMFLGHMFDRMLSSISAATGVVINSYDNNKLDDLRDRINTIIEQAFEQKLQEIKDPKMHAAFKALIPNFISLLNPTVTERMDMQAIQDAMDQQIKKAGLTDVKQQLDTEMQAQVNPLARKKAFVSVIKGIVNNEKVIDWPLKIMQYLTKADEHIIKDAIYAIHIDNDAKEIYEKYDIFMDWLIDGGQENFPLSRLAKLNDKKVKAEPLTKTEIDFLLECEKHCREILKITDGLSQAMDEPGKRYQIQHWAAIHDLHLTANMIRLLCYQLRPQQFEAVTRKEVLAEADSFEAAADSASKNKFHKGFGVR
jgi:serine/threonine protein kinase